MLLEIAQLLTAITGGPPRAFLSEAIRGNFDFLGLLRFSELFDEGFWSFMAAISAFSCLFASYWSFISWRLQLMRRKTELILEVLVVINVHHFIFLLLLLSSVGAEFFGLWNSVKTVRQKLIWERRIRFYCIPVSLYLLYIDLLVCNVCFTFTADLAVYLLDFWWYLLLGDIKGGLSWANSRFYCRFSRSWDFGHGAFALLLDGPIADHSSDQS